MAKKLAQIVSTQAFSPVSDVKGGIVITRDGRYVKILEFSSINFSLLSASDQESVTDSYGAALKNFPNNTQIKIVSKRADVEEYLRKLESDQRKETNAKCRQLQYEQVQLIEMAGATQGIAVSSLSFPTSRMPAQRKIRLSTRFAGPSCSRRITLQEVFLLVGIR